MSICNAFSCFPSPFSNENDFLMRPLKVEHDDESSLFGRVDCDWRYIPVLVTLCTCIIGIVASIFVFNQPYFAIMFALGAAGSLCALYFVHQMRDLQSFKKNNEQFSQSLGELQTELEKTKQTAEDLERTKDELEEQNKKLQVSVQTFNDQLETLGDENATLKVTGESLKESEEKLKEDLGILGNKFKDLKTLFDLQNDQIAKLNAAITELGKRSDQQRTYNLAFSQTKDEFNRTLGGFHTTQTEFKQIHEEFSKSYEEGQEAISAVVKNLTAVFGQHDEHIQTLHKMDKALQARNEQYIQITKEWANVQVKIGTLQGALEEVQKSYQREVQALAEVKDQIRRNTLVFAENNTTMTHQLDRLESVLETQGLQPSKSTRTSKEEVVRSQKKHNRNEADTLVTIVVNEAND